ncbi:MAG TPA: hypothetical protein GXX70_03000 [Tepidimicrobium sp.]|nr:hypothetical protein [Tepidimicrobium sp.]
MFPRSLLFFMAAMAVDIILKSIKTRKEIKKDRRQRLEEPVDVLETSKAESFEDVDKKPRVEKPMEIREKPKVKRPRVDRKPPIDKEPIKAVEGLKKKAEGKPDLFGEKLGEGVLKGMIFAEILSKPKALDRGRRV